MSLNFTENRRIAWIVLAVSVLVSVFLLGGGALGRERRSVMKVFNDGTNPSSEIRYSMDAYLDDAAEAASIMANEAELHMGESDLVNQTLSNAALIGEDTADLDARYRAYTDLKSQAEKLYNNMYGAVTGDALKNFKLAYDNFWGCDDMLGRDGYHKLAKNYNSLISGFPGGIVATLTRQGSLNTFGG